MSLHADLVGNEALSAPGTGTTITLGASATGFRSFLEAEGAGDVTNGQTLVPVTIASNFVDGIPTRRETATVTYNTGSPPTLTDRETIRSNNGGASIDAGADCVVYWELIASNVATVSDTAYDEAAWDGSLNVPTKNAVRDKFESLQRFYETSHAIAVAAGTPKRPDFRVYTSLVTTGGTAAEHQIILDGDGESPTPVPVPGTLKRIVATSVGGGDTLKVTYSDPNASHDTFMVQGDELIFQYQPSNATPYWYVVGGNLATADPSTVPVGVFIRDDRGRFSVVSDPGLLRQYETRNLAVDNPTPNNAIYSTFYITDGSAAPFADITVDSPVTTLGRKVIAVDTFTNVADTVPFTTGNLRFSGVQPTTVILADGASIMVLQSRLDGNWDIIDAAAGVVTP